MVKMSVINDALKSIVNAEKAGKRQVCDKFHQPLSLPVEETRRNLMSVREHQILLRET